MDNNAINSKMLSILARYRELVVQQLAANSKVGEYLTESVGEHVRLLCQMRTIAFLIKAAPYLDITDTAKAEALYLETEAQYFKEDQWMQKSNQAEPATLYSYSFVLLAQGYLYKATKNPLYGVALAETFSQIQEKFNSTALLFKPLGELDCFEQNSAMHLYEALSFAYYQADAAYMKETLVSLETLIKRLFWQTSTQLLAEKITADNEVLSYEAGHWFEWVSLLRRVNCWGGETVIDADALYQAALFNTTFTSQDLVINEMDTDLTPIEVQQLRIWPNLEYLRAKTLMEEVVPEQELSSFMVLFFDDQELPLEYVGEALQQPVKATTGYHIAESFVDILAVNFSMVLVNNKTSSF